MKRIVWLASWYPTEVNPLTGDFIKRHAQACSLFQPVHVIHVKKYPPGTNKKNNITVNGNPAYPAMQETIYYYNLINLFGIERLYSYLYSCWLYHKLVQQYSKQHGKPHLLHVHVMLRCGLVALYYKWVHNIPYVVTEHYGGYMPEAKGFIKGITPLNYWPLKLIAENASVVAPVSLALGHALQKKFTLNKLAIVPNTVDTDIFFLRQGIAKHNPTTFLHVSTLSAQKNPSQILQAFAYLKRQYNRPFELWIVGPPHPELIALAKKLHIIDEIKWFEETTQLYIAQLMQRVTALVLYSHFESFGCVNIEAMACGVPVIASNLPVFKEYLEDGNTGWFAPINNPSALAKVLNDFIDSQVKVVPEFIYARAKRFDYFAIGKSIVNLYVEATDN